LRPMPDANMPGDSIIRCTDLQKASVLGICPSGAKAVTVQPDFESDNPSYSTQPIVNASSKSVPADLSNLYLKTLLIKTTGSDMLEKVCTYLATHTSQSLAGAPPRTFAEAIVVRLALSSTIQRIFNGAVALTLFIAGCSLAVTVGGSIAERKRPVSLLKGFQRQRSIE
jgi:hypothetical protein